jgi:peroxiredoxin Q/BCP
MTMATIPLLAALLGANPIKVGEKAPNFTLPSSEGQQVTLSKLLEEGPVILYFFPKAFTPGCTKQTANFRDRTAEVAQKGARIVGISVDPPDKLAKFRAEMKASFTLLSDQGGKVSEQYVGLVPVLKVANRANIVVAQDGTVQQVVNGGDAVDPGSAIASCPARRPAS